MVRVVSVLLNMVIVDDVLCLVEASGWAFFAVELGGFHNRKGLVRVLEILMDDVLRRLE